MLVAENIGLSVSSGTLTFDTITMQPQSVAAIIIPLV
jgi:hypothetical protein